jgi:hypothetical protein
VRTRSEKQALLEERRASLKAARQERTNYYRTKYQAGGGKE